MLENSGCRCRAAVAAVGVLLIYSTSTRAALPPLPPAVLACADETDVLRRLSCFDREVAPYRQSKSADKSPSAESKSTAPAVEAPAAAGKNVAEGRTSEATAANAAPIAKHFSGRVVKLDHHADGFTVYLDNGQVWQYSDPTPASDAPRVGDDVNIDRSMGSYWLSSYVGQSLQVKRRPDSPVETPH